MNPALTDEVEEITSLLRTKLFEAEIRYVKALRECDHAANHPALRSDQDALQAACSDLREFERIVRWARAEREKR